MSVSLVLDGLKRPESPQTWHRTEWTIGQASAAGLFPTDLTNPNLSFDFTWHHNIPWKVLRDSFKLVLIFCSWETVDLLLNLYGMRLFSEIKESICLTKKAIGPTRHTASGATYEKWVKRFSGGEESLLGCLSETCRLSVTQLDGLLQKIAWQPWNIVEGPTESVRVEDPGSDDFDDFSHADPHRYWRYESVATLYRTLLDLERSYEARKKEFGNYKYMSENWDTRINNVLRGCQWLVNEPVVMFNPHHWRVVHWGGKAQTKKLSGKTYYLLRTRTTTDGLTMRSAAGSSDAPSGTAPPPRTRGLA